MCFFKKIIKITIELMGKSGYPYRNFCVYAYPLDPPLYSNYEACFPFVVSSKKGDV